MQVGYHTSVSPSSALHAVHMFCTTDSNGRLLRQQILANLLIPILTPAARLFVPADVHHANSSSASHCRPHAC